MNADGGEARCDQPPHFEIAEADDGSVELFMDWWEYAIRSWRKRASRDAVLTFLCELGPPPYAITGSDGAELSDRRQDALIMKDMIRALWQRVVEEAAHKTPGAAAKS